MAFDLPNETPKKSRYFLPLGPGDHAQGLVRRTGLGVLCQADLMAGHKLT